MRLLHGAGHEVVGEAADAVRFLELPRRLRPDLCVVDVRIPPDMDADGARADAALRAEHPGHRCCCSPPQVETRQCLELVTSGACGSLLADRLVISERTLETHVRAAVTPA